MPRIDLPQEKKKGHLTLLRETRTLRAGEYNALTVEERLRIVRNAVGRQKYDLIIEAVDSTELVQRLPSQEIYLLLKELGAEDCTELLAMTNTEQMMIFFDLDFWRDEEFLPDSALQWLAMLLETGEDNVLRTAHELDFDLLTVLLQKFITITRGLESLTDEDALAEGRLERLYDMDFRDSESAKIVGMFLDILYRHDRDFYIGLMESVRNEIPAEIEEVAQENRRGRLLDRGFPDPFEAMSVFSPIDAGIFERRSESKIPFQAGENGVEAPGFFLVEPAGDLLGEILSRGIEPETCWEMAYLLNKVMMAERADVGDLEQIAEKAREVYGYLNIALEYLGRGDFEKAMQRFTHAYLEHLLRLGLGLVMPLRERARVVKQSGAMTFLDGPFRALVESLCYKRPRFYEGMVEVNRAGERFFKRLDDIRLAEQWLSRIEIQVQLFDGRLGFDLPDPQGEVLKGCVPDQVGDLALSDLFLTAWGNRLLGRDFSPVPIAKRLLPELHKVVCADGTLREEVRREIRQATESLLPGAGEFSDYCLDLWQEQFCTLAPDALDVRFIGAMIIRLD
ncbi:DUF6178 family protein [Geoalkalibacter subterraneus]|uniref:Uncharacterized protein n=1 Tax=Geoalkalibacter subterraneus TaxID=483547 RepID=A0A0B5FCJ4_9BACT|nr:DUF6178 family protein [Geoalkalibacter subterraneus]AJF05902.1 hypothetical protein GSUB_04060 [Geoalkalibacter subterraneus]